MPAPNTGNGPTVELTLTVDVNVNDKGAHESFESLRDRFGVPDYFVPVKVKGGKGCYATVDISKGDDIDELIAVHFASFVTFEMEITYQNPHGMCYCGGYLDPEGWQSQPQGGVKCSMCGKLQYRNHFAFCSNCGFAICRSCEAQPNELKLIEVSLSKPDGGLGGLFLLEKSNVIASVLPSSSAAQNGMKKGMRIVAVNGQATFDETDVLALYTKAKRRKSFMMEFTFQTKKQTVMTSLKRHRGAPPHLVKEWMDRGYGLVSDPECYIEDAKDTLPKMEGYNMVDIEKLPPPDSIAAKPNTATVGGNNDVDINAFFGDIDAEEKAEEEAAAVAAEKEKKGKGKGKKGKRTDAKDEGDEGKPAKAEKDAGGGKTKKKGKKKDKPDDG